MVNSLFLTCSNFSAMYPVILVTV